jgi:Na+/H+-dicarboxylate symporter
MAGITTETSKDRSVSAPRGSGQGKLLSWLILAGLLSGLLVGVVIEASSSPMLRAIPGIVEPVGTLWVNAIRMTVIPLLISLLITAVASSSDAGGATRLGGQAMLLFVALVTLATVFGLITAPIALAPLRLEGAAAESLRAAAAVPESTQALSFRDWLVSLIPVNPIQAAAQGAVLPVVIFSLLFALALSRTAREARQLVVRFFEAVRDALFVLIRWILVVAPIGVFALVLPLAARLGASVAGAIGYYLVVVCSLLIGSILLLYVMVGLWGRLPLGRFARACAPAQAVAMGTRSSLASLPALLDAAKKLALPEDNFGLTLPLAVSVFKYASPVARLTGTLFVAKLYGITLGGAELMALAPALILLPFYSPGIPSGGLLVMAPVYMAVGLPLEGIGLLIALDPIPDMFLTTSNVTADLTAATLLSRRSRIRVTAPVQPLVVTEAAPDIAAS